MFVTCYSCILLRYPDIIYTTLCKMQQIYYIHNVVQMQLISYTQCRQMATLDAPKVLLLTDKTKLTLTVTLTLTDTVMVILFMRILSTPMKRLYRNNKRNFCGGAGAGFVGGPDFFPFSDFLLVCWQEFNSKFILYRWKEGFCGDI